MKRFTAGILALSFALLVGCNDKGTTGGPGVKSPDPTPSTANKGTFTIDVPNTDVSVKVGGTQTFGIGINRGNDFAQAVTLSFEGLPAGVTIRPESAVVATGMKDVELVVSASAEAVPGEYIIKVHGKPATGADAHSQFQVEIEKP